MTASDLTTQPEPVTDTGSTNDPQPALTHDDIFGLLRNSRRREVLRYLHEGGPADIGELAVHIASLENRTDPDSLRSEERKRVYISLYQSHLPTLSDAGVIDYDRDRGNVELTSRADRLLPYLDFEQTTEAVPWPRVGACVAVAGVIVVSVVWNAVPVGFFALLAAVTLLAVAVDAYVRPHQREQVEVDAR